jgi:transposase-like protein
MPNVPRKSDGRRIFSPEFKRRQIDRVLRGELTVAELGRKLRIAPSLLHRWKRVLPEVAAENSTNGEPTHELRSDEYIRQLQLLLGKQAVELELLREKIERLEKRRARR